MEGIRPQQFFYSGASGANVVLGQDQAAVLAEQLTQVYGRAGAKLRAGRVTGEHLNLLGRMLSGDFQDVRVDMTRGGMATATVGGKFVHIPMMDELAATVNVAGVKYAPMQNIQFDRGTGKYRVLTADQSLAVDMEGLFAKGISAHSQSRRARIVSKTIAAWQERQLQFVRAGVQEAGGALPFYVSKQATIREGPLYALAQQVEQTTLESIKAAKSGGFSVVGGNRVARSYALQRQGMIEELALAMGMLSAEDATGKKLFPSLGVKSLRLRGDDVFGNKRAKDGKGRLIVSTLSPSGYGLFAPGEQLGKGIHYLRAAMATSTGVVTAMRQHEATVAAQQGLKLRNIRNSRIFASAVDLAAEESLQHHAGQMGATGAQQLWTPMRVGVVTPRAGLNAQELEAAHRLIYDAFGDSGVLATTRSSSELVSAPLRSTKKVLSTYTGASGTYAQSRMHPLIEAEIRKAGMGGYIRFENPLTADMLGESHGVKGWLGRQTTSTGAEKLRRGKPVDVRLTSNERVRGVWVSRGKLKFDIERMGREGELQLGTAEVLGAKRVGVHGTMPSVHGVDRLVAGVGGWGPKMNHMDTELQTLGHMVYEQRGEAGLQQLADQLGYSTRRNAAGDLALIPNFDVMERQHLDQVKQAAAAMGLKLDPMGAEALGPDELEVMKRASPETMRLARKTGKVGNLLSINFRVMDWSGRAGQPQRGTFGNVEVRVRDQRIMATKLSGMSGMAVDELAEKSGAQMAKFYPSMRLEGRTGSNLARAASKLETYGAGFRKYIGQFQSITGTARNPVQQALLLQEYLASGVMPKELPAGIDVKRISAAEYRQKFGKTVGRLSPDSTIDDLRGTSFVNEAGEASKTFYIVEDIGGSGLLPSRRRSGTGGYAINGVLVPSGEAMQLTQNERIRLRKAGGDVGGLQIGHQRAGYELHDRILSGAEPNAIYEAHGAMALAMGERALGRGGFYHHAHIAPKASFFGTLSPDAKLKPYQISLSEGNVKEMLVRQGLTKDEAAEYVKEMRLGKRSYYTHFKIEPMRSGREMNVMEVKLRKNKWIQSLVGGDVVERRGQAIGVSPYVQPWWHRDNDYDQGMLFNLAGRDGLTVKEEQKVLKMLGSKDREYLKAAAAEVQHNISKMTSGEAVNAAGKKAAFRADHDAAITEAVRMLDEKYGIKVTMDAALRERASAYMLVSQPDMATAAANLRWRSTAELTSDIALSSSMEVFARDHGVDMNSAVIQDAIGTLRKDREAIEHARILFSESEYWTLKKESAARLLGDAGEFAHLADPRLATSALAAGYARGQTAIEKADQALAENIISVLGESEVNPLNVILRKRGIDPSKLTSKELSAAHMEIALPMARVVRAGATLSAEGVRSAQESVMSAGSTNIRDPLLEVVARLHGRAPSPVVGVADATGAGVMMAGDTVFDHHVMAREAAEAAGEKAGVISAQASEFASGAKAAVQKLWHSKWGIPAALGLGGLAAFGILRGMFRSSTPAYAPAGSPVPPNPLIQGVREDRMMDYNDVPNESFARVQRVNQVRTHMQISGDSNYNSPSGFTGSADLVYGRFGRGANHRGQFIDDGGGLADRSKVQEMVRRRMMSDHG